MDPVGGSCGLTVYASYHFEVLAQLNIRFGCTRARAQQGAGTPNQTGD